MGRMYGNGKGISASVRLSSLSSNVAGADAHTMIL